MGSKRILPFLAVGALALLALPSLAFGADLVDDPDVQGKLPQSARAYFAEREAEYQAWANGRAQRAPSRIVDAPYRVLTTTSIMQRRNDYCVPATTAILDRFARGSRSWTQDQWASYRYGGTPLWTDASGGNMWVMAMGLRDRTGVGYSFSSGNSATSVYERSVYGIVTKGRPVAYGVRIDADKWPNYRFDHAGHIMCGRGVDWRYSNSIYVDDPYPENAASPLGRGSQGGDTFGKKTYARSVIAGGVVASASQQVVY
ncbi:MAG: C39 family peptidase [Thermoleophilia bacterium]